MGALRALLLAAPIAVALPLPGLLRDLPPGNVLDLGTVWGELSALPKGGPQLAPAWTANVTTITSSTGRTSSSEGFYWYDQVGQRYREFQRSSGPSVQIFSPTDEMVSDTVTTNATNNMTIGKGRDAVCKPIKVPFVDPFVWLQLSTRNGSAIVDGEACQIWSWRQTQPTGQTTEMSACIAADGAPRELNTTSVGLLQIPSTSHRRFTSVKVGPPRDEDFATSIPCATNYPTKPCDDAHLVSLDLYRIHGAAEPLDLSNRNVGDALGDMAFVCALDAVQTYKDSHVTHWTVMANSSWGQYGYCLYRGGKNFCYGGADVQVGRESALGLGRGHLQGQCSENDDVGSWFSMPGLGECKADEAVGTNGCTWGQSKRIRTVAASCILEERGLAAACAKERGHAPFTRSVAIFQAALASDDPAKGGCPSVGVESIVV